MLGAWSVNPRHAVVWGWVSDVAIWPAQTPSKGLSRSICRSPKAGFAGSNPAGGAHKVPAQRAYPGWDTDPRAISVLPALPKLACQVVIFDLLEPHDYCSATGHLAVKVLVAVVTEARIRPDKLTTRLRKRDQSGHLAAYSQHRAEAAAHRGRTPADRRRDAARVVRPESVYHIASAWQHQIHATRARALR